MTVKMKCDVCGNGDYIAGVCCSSLGAVSFCYCTVCLAVGAEPKGILDQMNKRGLIENHQPNYIYKDKYYNLKTNKLFPIILVSGKEFKSRSELITFWDKAKEDRK